VEGFPTIKWFVGGEATEYTGGRTAGEIVKFVKKKTGPAAQRIATAAEAEAFTAAGGAESPFVVGVFSAFEGEAYDVFVGAARKEEKVEFIETSSIDVAISLGAKFTVAAPLPALGLVKPYDELFAGFTGGFVSEEIVAFVKSNKLPLVIPFSEERAEEIFFSGIPSQVLLFYSSEDDDSDDVEGVFHEAAKATRGKTIAVSVDVDDEQTAPVLEFFGLSASTDFPKVVGYEMDEAKDSALKFHLTEAYSQATVEAFALAMIAGELEPHYASEEIPEKNDAPVTIVVGKNFKDICMDPTKDVLLEVYAPWCGHCKQLEPTYKKLGKRFKAFENIVIAKMDGTANEHPLVNVEGFPTILFYPAVADKEAVTFEGERTLKGFTKYLKQNAMNEFELPKKAKAEMEEEEEASVDSDDDVQIDPHDEL